MKSQRFLRDRAGLCARSWSRRKRLPKPFPVQPLRSRLEVCLSLSHRGAQPLTSVRPTQAARAQAVHGESCGSALREANEGEKLNIWVDKSLFCSQNSLSMSLYSTHRAEGFRKLKTETGRKEGNGEPVIKRSKIPLHWLTVSNTFQLHLTTFLFLPRKCKSSTAKTCPAPPITQTWDNAEIRNIPRSMRQRDGKGATEAPSALWMIQRALHFPHAVGTESVPLYQNLPKRDVQPVTKGTMMKKPVTKNTRKALRFPCMQTATKLW